MSTIYYPQGANILERNTTSGSQVVEVLSVGPANVVFYFDSASNAQSASIYTAITASYAVTSSYALNGGSGGGGSTTSASWASQSLSSSYSVTSSNTTMYPDITENLSLHNVGIKTKNAQYSLDVSGSIHNSDTQNYFFSNDAEDNWVLGNGGGLFGINTSSPQNALDVVGNISCSAVTASLFYGTASVANTSSYLRLYDATLNRYVVISSVNGILTVT